MELSVDISKREGNFHLDVQLEAGDAPIALLGAAGCGKTLTLRCIAGLEKPDRGRIVLNERVLFDSETGVDLPPQKRRVGLLSRGCALFPHMTVRQNVAAGVWDQEDRERMTAEKLRQFQLEDAAHLRPAQLTGEQRQRTALARLLASQPRAILLDEPFAGLEAYFRFPLELELADALADFSGPVLWVSHDRGEVYRNCRYVCVLEQGRSQEIATVTGLLSHPGTESAARLSGCRNYADAIPRENAVFLPQWGVTLRCAYPLPPFLWRVGIRSRSVHLATPDAVNAFSVQVERVIEDVSSTVVLLRPVGAAQDAPPLLMELEKNAWLSNPDKERLTVSVGPQDILLLRQNVPVGM